MNVSDLYRMRALINSVWSSAYETQQKVVQTDAVIINLLNVQTRFLIFFIKLPNVCFNLIYYISFSILYIVMNAGQLKERIFDR